MSREQHYAEAERLLKVYSDGMKQVTDLTKTNEGRVKAVEYAATSLALTLAHAQVHATLAIATPQPPPDATPDPVGETSESEDV